MYGSEIRDFGYDEGTFTLGQTVYRVEDVTHRFWLRKKCVYCDSTGVVLLKGKEFECPNCKNKTVCKEVVERIISPTVEKIRSVITLKTHRGTQEIYTNDSSGLGLLIQKTPNGSNRYFGSREEAQQMCDEYNKQHNVHVLLDEYKRQEIRNKL